MIEKVAAALAEIDVDGTDRELLEKLSLQLRGPSLRKAANAPLKVLGVWYAFPQATSLFREGITRFTCTLLEHLISRYGIEVEIWAYEINREEMERSFAAILSNPTFAPHCRIMTERTWPNESLVTPARDNLHLLANQCSRADLFMIVIHYLDSGVYLDRPVIVALHDLVTFELYEQFASGSLTARTSIASARRSVDSFARRGAWFFCSSDYVRERHGLHYVHNLRPERIVRVYLPVNVPLEIHARIKSEGDLREAFGLAGRYLFYPTQLRPHKNVATLLRALGILIKRGADITLVLTAPLEDDAEASMVAQRESLSSHVRVLRGVSEVDLYSLHAHAAAAVVPTLFEGGFPWQALEAMLMNTPAIFSRLRVVEERVRWAGLDAPQLTFEPLDAEGLANLIERVLQSKERAVEGQRAFRDALLAYDWSAAVEHYYDVLNRAIGYSRQAAV